MDGEKSSARRRLAVIALLIVLLVIGVWFFLTRDPFPPRGADSLRNAVAVKSWDKAGLVLSDDRRLPLPGLKELPEATSVVLRMATKNGVEIQPDGRVVGLMPVYAERGSDAWHPQYRIDLSRLLLYTDQGVPARPLSEDARRCLSTSPTVNDRGYEAKQFLCFRTWCDLIDQGRLELIR
jgi:hypothetical protein